MDGPAFKQKPTEIPQQVNFAGVEKIPLNAASRQVLSSAVEQALVCIFK